jgi:DNA-binding winged helix-turn-helix (wHTH) protein
MRILFGDCLFDDECRQLTSRGEAVHAGPKLLRLLEILIEKRPHAVTKQEIYKSVWTGTFVSEATLTSLVADLRSAIGDTPRAPKFVRTVHGYGYAFCGEVQIETTHRSREAGRIFRIIFADREIGLPQGKHILGRSNEVAIFVDDAGVSRRHARITVSAQGAILEDLGSKNGTMLDGCALRAPAPLHDGALIVLGATGLKFRIFDSPASTDSIGRSGL